MYATRNDLPETTRAAMSELLNARLADAIDLMLRGKQAHWNVRGPNFIALHELFDDVVEESEEWVDLLAERVLQLGGRAEGTLDVVARRSHLERYPTTLSSEREHLEALAASIAALGRAVRAGIETASAASDADTADILTEISRGCDKRLWFLEAHFEARP